MAGSHEGIDHCDTCACFSSSGCHHQEEVPSLRFDSFENRSNRSDLVVAASNICIDQFVRERLTISSNILQAFKIISRWKADDLSRREVAEIPKEDLETVRIEAIWQLTAMLRLNVVAILLGLLATDRSIFV